MASIPYPSLEELRGILSQSSSAPSTLADPASAIYPSTSTPLSPNHVPQKPNLVPVFIEIPADLLTPVTAYLKVAEHSEHSFLLESIIGGESVGRYSFVGASESKLDIVHVDPFQILRTGPDHDVQGDPLVALEKTLEPYRYVKLPQIPTFTGGAVGFISYDAISHFEPVTTPNPPLKTAIDLPEAFFMLTSTMVIFDHIFQTVKLVSHVHIPDGTSDSQISSLYDECIGRLHALRKTLLSPHIPHPPQGPVKLGNTSTSNVGKAGYEGHVTTLKKHILKGDIIQAVPSQRLARPTDLHPFNIYRQLRRVNPSPYMFYLDCGGFSVVGASPETLCKVESRKVYNHAIAGTVRRGKTPAEDEALGKELLASEKDRAEHIMLVDLARNDVNRVCKPETVQVDSLMQLEKFSHVTHLTSQISGHLRDDQSRFDAFRSIFPAGTVSGAPKIKAIQLISSLEKERRGVYAGAVGRFDFDREELDTCIALRTMVVKDGSAYLQAGGGIVFDSVEEDEYMETIHKMGANVRCIEEAERESCGGVTLTSGYWASAQ